MLFSFSEPGKHYSALYSHYDMTGQAIGRKIVPHLPGSLRGFYDHPYFFMPFTEHTVHERC